MFELSEVMRQKEDQDFAEILNRIREGKHTEADIRVLRERILKLSPEHPDYPINSTHLFSTNVAVDQHNHDIFHKSTNEKIAIKAIDIVLGDLSDELKERLKNKYQTILQKPWAYTQFVPYLKTQNMMLQQTCQLLMV